ncbi:MAG: phosphoribosylglycinamide formyltransferase [Lachnospiraceae bacterium]|nr:phosphoribosylglycinamide formyltransferase [Lachnospiraceae bacterium]
MLRLAVLVSGGGTNLQAIIDGIESGKIRDTEIALVISNKEGAYALKCAEKAGIDALCISPKAYDSGEAYDQAMIEEIDQRGVGLVVLAGFLVVLSEEFTKHYAGKIINIHPSLIPSFCGNGYYGLRVHEEVLKRGVKVTGATVHFVDAGTDTGPIILQKPVAVERDDTPEILQRRVMEEAEWLILPEVIDAIAHDRVRIEDKIAYVI